MSHYEERLQQDLDRIRELTRSLGQQVEAAVEAATQAVLTADSGLAAEVILGDHPINRSTRSLDRRCHAFVARHLPSAGHLRFISAVLRLLVAIERVGDYAVTVCREVVQLRTAPTDTVARDIEMVAKQSQRTFSQAMQAFVDSDPDLARGTMDMTSQVRSASTRVFEDLAGAAESQALPVRSAFGFLVVLNRLERIGDQAKNICEETVFAATGEGKQPKVYRVQFVDERNDGLSKLAECIGRKVFPESGSFSSAGWAPASGISSQLAEFLEAHSLGGDETTAQFAYDLDHTSGHHVIVGLAAGLENHMDSIPFHTVVVNWEIEANGDLAGAHMELSTRIQDLMHTLRGADAS